MQNGVTAISQKELTRYDVLRRALEGTISLRAAAGYLGVSYRQAIRLKKDAGEGVASLAHGNRGKSPSNKMDEEVRTKVLELSQGDYKVFNDTHFTEELVKMGITISRESVRTMRRKAGIAPKRKRRP